MSISNDQLSLAPDPQRWETVNRNLLAKILAELMHEKVLQPELLKQDAENRCHFRLQTDREDSYYLYSAYPRALDYYHIIRDSIQLYRENQPAGAADAAGFFVQLQQTIGMKSFTLARYIEELNHTLYADASILAANPMPAAVMADAGYQEIEHQMTGHPWVIVNKGRIGFNAQDYTRYTPEAGKPMQLSWLAIHHSRATFQSLRGITPAQFYAQELGSETLSAFQQVLVSAGHDPGQYWLLPVHEWQWHNRICMQYAADLAAGLLVYLGEAGDFYGAQQSIRTLYNLSAPEKHYVKTAVSILSTGNIRGLSPRQMRIAPRVTAWVKGMLADDTCLQEMGLVLLGEVATVACQHPHYQAIPDAPYQYREMLGALWRESAAAYLRPQEKMMTMAALLYTDAEGNSLTAALIARSGLTAAAWTRAYLKAYLEPLLQLYYRHSLCVTPHGENIILILKDHVPVRMIIKDFVDDIVLTRDAREKLPADLADGMIQSSNPEDVPLFILLGVFDAFFRYLGDILHSDGLLPEQEFWEIVSGTIQEYQAAHPELQQKFERFDLFVPEFSRFYINSLRLFSGYEEGTGFAIPKKGGVLRNPIARTVPQLSSQ